MSSDDDFSVKIIRKMIVLYLGGGEGRKSATLEYILKRMKHYLPLIILPRFVGGNEVPPIREQTNATEVDNPRTWAAHSLLRIRGEKVNHGLPVRCLSFHPASGLPAVAESKLDVHCEFLFVDYMRYIK